MNGHEMAAQAFRSGDRVLVNGEIGTIINVYPDGIHLVKLDRNGKIIAVTAAQLVPAQPEKDRLRMAG